MDHPARPLARAEIEAKFRANAGRTLRGEAVETVLAETLGIENAENLATLAAALRALG